MALGVIGHAKCGNLLIALLGATALTSCGPGQGSTSVPSTGVLTPPAPTPSPTPSPTATPTPAPSPKPVNTSLPPWLDEKFDAASSKLIATVQRATNETSEVTLASRASFGTLGVTFDATTKAYTLADEASARTFLPANLFESNRSYDKYVLQGAAEIERFDLFRPSADNPILPLSYSTYFNWLTYQDGFSSSRYLSRFGTFGVATAFDTVLKTGTASFSGIADGTMSLGGKAYRLTGSTGTVTIDYATRVVKIAIVLRGSQGFSANASSPVELGTISSTSALSTSVSRYTGTAAGLGMEGSIGGGLYGPKAIETGLAFSLKNGSDTAVGVLVAR